MTINAVSAEDFDRVARQHCRGWGPDSLSVVRALLVNLERPADVAKKFDKTPQHVNVLKKRFLDKMAKAAAVKVPADQFMLRRRRRMRRFLSRSRVKSPSLSGTAIRMNRSESF